MERLGLKESLAVPWFLLTLRHALQPTANGQQHVFNTLSVSRAKALYHF
jgi:hypothetical protein